MTKKLFQKIKYGGIIMIIGIENLKEKIKEKEETE